MKYIKSISELIFELSNSSKEGIKGLIDRLEIPISDFEKISTWDQNYYTRNCITSTENFELILLCWQANQETSIHCHNDQDCWVYLIEGDILENQYKNNEFGLPVLTKSKLMKKNGSYFINDAIGLHSLHNFKKKRALSLHIYVNPIEECSYYNKRLKEYKIKTLSYNSLVTL